MLLILFLATVYILESGCELLRAVLAWTYDAKIEGIRWYPHRWHSKLYTIRVCWSWRSYLTTEALQVVYFSPVVFLIPIIFLFGIIGTWITVTIASAAAVVFLFELWGGNVMRLRLVPKSFAALVTLSVVSLVSLAVGLVLL